MSSRGQTCARMELPPAFKTARSSQGALFALVLAAAACSPEVQIADAESAGGTPSAGTGGAGAQMNGGNPTGGTDGQAGAAGAPEGGAPDVPSAPPRILADSVADFELTQGLYGWYYGVDDGSVATFTQMGRQSTITSYQPPTGDVWPCWKSDTTHWAQLSQIGAHPNGSISSPPSQNVLERAVRRWVSTYEGSVLITGELAKIDVTADDSNGVEGKVFIDGTELYSQVLEPTDGGGVTYSIEAEVRIGSTVDFVLDPYEGDDHHDLTRFTAVIVVAPAS